MTEYPADYGPAIPIWRCSACLAELAETQRGMVCETCGSAYDASGDPRPEWIEEEN